MRPKVSLRISAFEREYIAEIEKTMNKPVESGEITCNCCWKYFMSEDRHRIHYCDRCLPHYLNRGSLGCPLIIAEHGGVSLCRKRLYTSDNIYRFNGSPRCKDRRRRYEDLPEEEEFDLFEEDLGVRVVIDRDE